MIINTLFKLLCGQPYAATAGGPVSSWAAMPRSARGETTAMSVGTLSLVAKPGRFSHRDAERFAVRFVPPGHLRSSSTSARPKTRQRLRSPNWFCYAASCYVKAVTFASKACAAGPPASGASAG